MQPNPQPARSVTVVANCHCLPLADALALCTPGITTDFIDVNFAREPTMADKIAALSGADAPLVFTQPISDLHGPVATSSLRQRLSPGRVVTFTNIHFVGLHPDITYLGSMGGRVQSFFGDYHSKLALFGYATRRTLAECLRLFDPLVYEAVGYLSAFTVSAAELRAREAACDVQFAETFLAMARQVPSLFTINHPTAPVFCELAATMASHAGLEFRRMGAPYAINQLANSYVWPVYDPIAEANGLAYRTPPFFIAPAGRASRSWTIEEFVAGCYDAYDGVEFRHLAAVVTQAPFYEEFAAKLGI